MDHFLLQSNSKTPPGQTLGAAPASEQDKHLRDYLRVVCKRWVLILACTLCIFAYNIYRIQSITPMYEASAEVLIERNVLQRIGTSVAIYYNPNSIARKFSSLKHQGSHQSGAYAGT